MSDYSVGITLSLTDGVSSALTAIGGRMELLNNQATTLNYLGIISGSAVPARTI